MPEELENVTNETQGTEMENAPNVDSEVIDGGIANLKDVEVLTDDEAKIQEIETQLANENEDTQPLPTEQEAVQQPQEEQLEQVADGNAQPESSTQQFTEQEYQLPEDQLQPVEPVPLDVLERNIEQMFGNDLKRLDEVFDNGEGSISDAMKSVLAKWTQAIGAEIASSLQPVLVPMQQQLQLQQAQSIWQQFVTQHPDATDPDIYNTMRSALEAGEATTYQAAYDLARARTGKIGNNGGNGQQKPAQRRVDKAKQAAASLISSTATRTAETTPSDADSIEEAMNKSLIQLGLK